MSLALSTSMRRRPARRRSSRTLTTIASSSRSCRARSCGESSLMASSFQTSAPRGSRRPQIRILASVESPYIIKFNEAFVHNMNLYIITEYAGNGDDGSCMYSMYGGHGFLCGCQRSELYGSDTMYQH